MMRLFVFSLIGYFVLHSFLANTKVKNFLIPKFISQKYYRIVYNFIAAILLLPIALQYKAIIPQALFQNTFIYYLGIPLLFIGIILLIYALMQYNLAAFSGLEWLKEDFYPRPQKLKTNGFNSFVRHPLYFATIIITWAWFFIYQTDLALMLTLIFNAYIIIGTKLEEQKLLKEFGKDYLAYQKKVSMLIPFKNVFKSKLF